jgi:L-lactate dehydrogenase complex protein LldG
MARRSGGSGYRGAWRIGAGGSLMPHADAGRRDMLRAIRESLSASAPQDELERATSHDDARTRALRLPLLHDSNAPHTAASASEPGSTLARFQQRLEAVGGKSVLARNESEAASALATILSKNGVRRVAVSNAPLVERLVATCGDRVRVERVDHLSRDDLFDCDAGVTTAQWGIAETGTLVLESAREKSRLLSLVPAMHVAILRTASICESLAEALDRVDGAAERSRAVTMITGPSRTSDIELTLTIGVHGPQALHVILLEDAS